MKEKLLIDYLFEIRQICKKHNTTISGIFFDSDDDSENCIAIDDKNHEPLYTIYFDGVCYNNKTGGDLPEWVFEVRDLILGGEKQ